MRSWAISRRSLTAPFFVSGVHKGVQGGVQREETITGRAGLQQQATSPKLAKSIEIQST